MTDNVVTPEVWEKLLEILNPYATKKRAEMAQRGGRFVHYTSAENALKIINTKNLWMRNTKCMIDYRELQHGLDELRSVLGKASPSGGEFVRALDACCSGITQQAFAFFEGWWKDVFQHLRHVGFRTR